MPLLLKYLITMQAIALNKEVMAAKTKEELLAFFTEHGYDWSADDITAYYNELHPAPLKKAPKETEPKP